MLISRRPKLSKLRPPQVSLFSHLAHLIRNIHRKRERGRPGPTAQITSLATMISALLPFCSIRSSREVTTCQLAALSNVCQPQAIFIPKQRMWLAQLPKCHLHSVPLSQAIPASWATLTGHSVLDRVDGGRGVRGQEQAAAKVAQLQQHQLHQLLHPIQIMFHDELGD